MLIRPITTTWAFWVWQAQFLDPRWNILTNRAEDSPGFVYLANNQDEVNTVPPANPAFVFGYENGGRGTTVKPGELTTNLVPTAAFDEGGNFIRVRFGPLTMRDAAITTSPALAQPITPIRGATRRRATSRSWPKTSTTTNGGPVDGDPTSVPTNYSNSGNKPVCAGDWPPAQLEQNRKESNHGNIQALRFAALPVTGVARRYPAGLGRR